MDFNIEKYQIFISFYLLYKLKNIKYGFGGISRLGQGTLDSSLILSEHYRMGSTRVILSRDFHGSNNNFQEFKNNLNLRNEVDNIRKYFNDLQSEHKTQLILNNKILIKKVSEIIRNR